MARFKTGESGNLNGRPKGSISITSAVKKKLGEVNPKTQREYLSDLVDVMVEKAITEKDFRMIKEIWNHTDGSPRQTLEEVGQSRHINVVFDESYKERERLANEAIESFISISRQSAERYGVKNDG